MDLTYMSELTFTLYFSSIKISTVLGREEKEEEEGGLTRKGNF